MHYIYPFNILLKNSAIIGLITLAIAIPVIIAQWKLFKKAGKNGWEAIIPYYSNWVSIEIAGLNWWYFLILISGTILNIVGIYKLNDIANLAGYFVNFLIYYNIAKRTKQNEILYGILGIIFPYIAILILGFSNKVQFDNSATVSPNGVFGAEKSKFSSKKSNSNFENNAEDRYCLGCGNKTKNKEDYCDKCKEKYNL